MLGYRASYYVKARGYLEKYFEVTEKGGYKNREEIAGIHR
jgi:hypothetical protein